jgi:cystine transport system substrate-binding protein
VTPRSAVRALAGGIGVVAGIVACAVVAAGLLVALGLPSESRADDPPPTTTVAPEPRPTELVVALGLGDPVLQAGVVRDGEVIIARGLEVDIARNLAKRLGIPRVRFVYVKPGARLLAAKARPWDLTIASIRPGRPASAGADLSDPYLGTDQAVVLRRGLPRLASLGDLRRKITCAVRGSDGARAIAGSVRPLVKSILAPSETRLLELVQTGACDAALVDAGSVGQFVAGRGGILGPVSARVERGGGYVVGVTRGGPIAVSEVDRALARMRADGTMHRLARQWLGIDPARLRPLS